MKNKEQPTTIKFSDLSPENQEALKRVKKNVEEIRLHLQTVQKHRSRQRHHG